MHRINTAFLVFTAIWSSPVLAQDTAEQHPFLSAKFALSVGVFYPDRDIRLRASGSIEPAPEELIDFGEEFSISESDSTFAAEFGWRYTERWSFRMQYFDSEGESTAVLDEDIEWEDLVFLEGTRASAGTGFELTRFFWGYSLYQRPSQEFGIGAGFHWLHVSAFIAGTAETPDGPQFAREGASVDAPLPNIGLWYIHALSPRWAFRTRLDYFNADIYPYDGTFVNATAGLNFKANEWFNIGAAYNYVELDVGVDGSNWRGEIKTRYDGIYVYLGASW
jgi:hypothetical protein